MTYLQWVTQYRIIKKEERNKNSLTMDIIKDVFKAASKMISDEFEYNSIFVSLFSGNDKRMIREYIEEQEKKRIKEINPDKEFKDDIDFFDEIMGDNSLYPDEIEIEGSVNKDVKSSLKKISKKSLGIQMKKGGE